MKKGFLLLMMVLFTVAVNAQMIRTEELEKYAKEKYGDKWVDAARNIASQVSLDKNNGLTYTQVINAPGKSKDQLYIILNYWYTATFNDANSVIKLNDKDDGCIIGQGYISDIAAHSGGSNTYDVNIRPIIKTDIKDGKIRVTYSVPSYNVVVISGGGILGALSAGLGGKVNTTKYDETWPLDTCFPFAKKDHHKQTSCKALVMTHAFSNVIMDKIEEAVKNGVSGNETENW